METKQIEIDENKDKIEFIKEEPKIVDEDELAKTLKEEEIAKHREAFQEARALKKIKTQTDKL